MEVNEAGSLMRVTLRVLPPQRVSAEVRSKAHTFTVTTDDDGRADFGVPPGLFSLILRPLRSPRSQPLQTAWVRL